MMSPLHGMKDEDLRVLERVQRAPTGASAIDIAKTVLGPKAKRHSAASLTAIGLSVACRLCGAGLIDPTRANRFVARRNV
jgi:hypothetical protein